MLNTAAAIRTPRTPRRRPQAPAAWERAGAVSGVLGARWSRRRPRAPSSLQRSQLATIAVVAGIASFVDLDRLAPGEPVAARAWFLVALLVYALAALTVAWPPEGEKESCPATAPERQ
jgi:hypothetical protein